jgi:ribonucleoside-triphosphate reductase (formate)
MDRKLLLFTTPICPRCPAAKKLLEDRKVTYELIDASKPRGLDMARKFQIMQVPTLIILDGEKILAKAHGVDEIEKHIK